MKRKRLNHDVDSEPAVVTPKRARSEAAKNNGDLSSKSAQHSVNKGNDDAMTESPSKRASKTPNSRKASRHDATALAVRGRDLESDEEDPMTETLSPTRSLRQMNDTFAKGKETRNGVAVHADIDPGSPEERLDAPVKKPRGRPPGRPRKDQRQRTPSPVDLPAHEHYFFQNRNGAGKTSDHTLSSLSLLSHDEYFQAISRYQDPHGEELDFLQELHSKSFDQWSFELHEGFNICLYGWGSKRKLLTAFAEHIQDIAEAADAKIVIANGYAQGITIRDILATVAAAIPELSNQKLGAQPHDMLERISTGILSCTAPITLIINSVDSQPLRRGAAQSILASLGNLTNLNLVVSVDSPNYALLWDSTLSSKFNFVHHDTTTFVPFDIELGASDGGVVDSVNALFGRYGRAISGKEGVVFVLRSLTDNARRLYALLVAEILSIADNAGEEAGGVGDFDTAPNEERDGEEELGEFDTEVQSTRHNKTGKATGLEYNMFYRKAMSQLIATNEIAFRTLLKEFYDHQMLVSRKDALGTEFLSVPFRREECQAILEDLIID